MTDASGATGGSIAMLVVGARGTLEPEAAALHLNPGERLSGEALPPLMKELLAPWLSRAAKELDLLHNGLPAMCGAEPVPLQDLLCNLELHLAELMAQALDEWLTSTPGRGGAAFWQVYPALRALVAGSVHDWAAGTALFLARLTTDEEHLAQCLGQSVLPAVVSVVPAASDRHPGGAMTLKITFAGGGCMFYKPRAVTGEWLWRALLEAIAALDSGVQLPSGRVVRANNSDSYGWMESLVEGEAWPGSAEERSARLPYWEQAGVLLCLAQHAGLTDLHLGNVLATRHGPSVLDAECLGSALPRQTTDGEFAEASKALTDTGLLQRSAGLLHVDTSGFFGRSGPVAGIQVSRWVVSQTGSWRLGSFPAALMQHGNVQKDSGTVSPRAVASGLCAGYRAGAELLMRARASLLAPGSGWRHVLANVHAPRCILRETLFYGQLLSRSLQPACLGDADTRRRIIVQALSCVSMGLPARVVQAEARALAAGSIPRVVAGPGNCIVSDSQGRRLWRNPGACTPAEAVMQTMQALTPERLQATLLPALLAALL